MDGLQEQCQARRFFAPASKARISHRETKDTERGKSKKVKGQSEDWAHIRFFTFAFCLCVFPSSALCLRVSVANSDLRFLIFRLRFVAEKELTACREQS
jgi:hypothetical protein